MPSITVRRLDPNWEPIWGNGQANFLSDIDAVAQLIAQRLKLLEGEWWEDLTDGLPFFQGIAGFTTGGNHQQSINLLIQNRILGTPFVTGIEGVQSNYDSSRRAYNFFAVVQTQFGPITITNAPTPPSRVLPQ